MPAGKGGGGSADFNTRDIIEMTPGLNAGGITATPGWRPGGFGYQITAGATPERQANVQGMSTALSNKAERIQCAAAGSPAGVWKADAIQATGS